MTNKITNRIHTYNDTNSNPKRWNANDNIHEFVKYPEELDDVQEKIEEHFQAILDIMSIDTINDHNTKETAKRVAKMYVREIFAGRFVPMPKITAFPNVGGNGNGTKGYDQIYITGPIKIRSTCAHHFLPIIGNCWIGIKPGKEVVGLSKFNRLVDWIASRPQIQEEMTEQIADLIEEQTKPEALAVVIKAQHFCMISRGVKEHESDMTTSIMRGKMRDDAPMRQEFLTLMNNMKGHNN